MLTANGLTLKEIFTIVILKYLLLFYQCNVNSEDWNLFALIFSEYIIEYNGYYGIYSKQLKKALSDINYTEVKDNKGNIIHKTLISMD